MPAGARALLCAAVVVTVGCNLENPGDEPPRGLLYFPNAMTLSKQDGDAPPRYLFVANSDFDLRYSSGSLQAYSLERLAAGVDRCRNKPPGCTIQPSDVLEDEVLITPFATAVGLSSDGSYLFAATRTDKTLLFIHASSSADGGKVLECGEDAERRCTLRADGGRDVLGDDGNPLPWPKDPEALTAGPMSDWAPQGKSAQGEYVVVAHRGGDVSLFVLREDRRGKADELTRTDVIGGLPAALTQAVYDHDTKLIYLPVSAASPAKVLDRVGVVLPQNADGSLDSAHALLYDAGYLQLEAVAAVNDTRDIAFIAAVPDAGDGLSQDRALIVAEEPSALLLADVSPARNPPRTARVKQTTVVGRGASRVVVGNFDGHPLAAVGSFGTRELAMIDLPTMLPLAVVPNLSGPFALALDEPRKLLYVADFRSSVIRIVDLAPLLDPASQVEVRVIATLGAARVLQELQ
jgi:hypothetical protein